MKLIIKKLPKSQVEMKIEVLAEEFNRFIDRATLDLGKDLELKGFRKGKVPKEIIEKEIGSEKILIEAADSAVRNSYRKAILENKIEAISQPEIEIKKLAPGNEFVFSAKTAVLPEIKLPDYKKIASEIERKKIVVEENEVIEALKWLQRSRAKLTLKNQPAQKGDFVEIEYLGRKDAFILGEGHFIPGFEKEIIGMKANEEKDNIILKKNGKDLRVKVKVNSVQNIEFPETNDQFARSLGRFENLSALKKSIKEGINVEKKLAESQRARNEILERISEKTECEIPEVLIEREQNQTLENLKKNISENLKISFIDYLNKIKKTEKDILESFLPQTWKRVKGFLILREIGKREKIEVSEEEIKSEVDKRNLDPVKSREAGISQKAKLFNGVDLEELREYTKEAIRTEKVFRVLESLVKEI